MRRSIVLTVILWTASAIPAFAACPPVVVKPEPRSGTLVVISVDYCPTSPVSSPPASPSGAAAAPAAPQAGPSTPVTDLYKQWNALTKPASGAAGTPGAAPGAVPQRAGLTIDADTLAKAFSLTRGLLDPPETRELKGIRIDERDRVTIVLTHFNFINFAAEYTIDKTVIEAYVTLNKLWTQVLGLGSSFASAAPTGTAPCPQGAAFEQCVVDWMWAQVLTSRQLNALTSMFNTQVALDKSSIDNHVTPDSAAMQTLRAQLVQIQSDTLTRRPMSMQEIEWYNQVQASHDKLLGQVDAYLRLAALTISGQTKNIDKQAAGTLVTVKIAAIDALGNPANKSKPVEIQYFVHSKYPVTFHAGYLYSSLKEVKFDQVRTIAGADLFQQVHQPESVNTYAAFLSYELYGSHVGRRSTGVLATLGTDFKDPGTRLYVGGSVKFLSRIYAGAGVVSSSVSEGVNPVVEQLGTTLGTRELFAAVTTRRDWKPYFHLSFGVFN